MKTFSFIFRLIILPFMVFMFILNAVRLVLVWTMNYILYGSEMIVFDEKINRETVKGILEKLTKAEK